MVTNSDGRDSKSLNVIQDYLFPQKRRNRDCLAAADEAFLAAITYRSQNLTKLEECHDICRNVLKEVESLSKAHK